MVRNVRNVEAVAVETFVKLRDMSVFDAETHRSIRFEPRKRCIATNYGTTRCLPLATMDVDSTKMLKSAVRRNTLMNAFEKCDQNAIVSGAEVRRLIRVESRRKYIVANYGTTRC